VLLIGGLLAAGEGGRKPVKIGRYNPNARTVDLFAAIEDGQIAVRLATQGAFSCRTAIQNKTDEPLNVKLPDSFVGVPILAQVGSDPGSGTQTLGGGMGSYGSAGATGVLSLLPKKAAQFNVPMVCLEYEKPGPDPGDAYEIKPVESFTTKAGVAALCEMLGNGKIGQNAAQAAAWHLNNDMGWDRVSALRVLVSGYRSRTYFSRKEVEAGKQAAAEALKTAKERKKTKAAKLYPRDSAGAEQPAANIEAAKRESGAGRKRITARPTCCRPRSRRRPGRPAAAGRPPRSPVGTAPCEPGGRRRNRRDKPRW
jgi:hypothetical protein